MSLESEISSLKSKIGSLKRELSSVESDLSRAHSDKMRATSNSSMGIAMMANSSTRAYGTYSYLSGSNNAMALSSKISRLESEKDSLKRKIDEKEKQLRDLESQFEYEKRPEAVLVSSEDGVYIEGDIKKTNIFAWAEEAISSYIQDYKRVIASEEVAEYKKLDEEIKDFASMAQLPEASEENVRALEVIQRRNKVPFEYVVIDGKIIVNSDFASQSIAREQSTISQNEESLKKNQEKREGFKPTTMGRLFRGVRKKQQAQFDGELDVEDEKYKAAISDSESKIKELETAKEIYIEPSTPIMEKLDRLIELCASKDVRVYVYESDDLRKHINNHTILKSGMKYDIVSKTISQAKGYLNAHNLKLTEKQILRAIEQGEYKGDVAVELVNAIRKDELTSKQKESVGPASAAPSQKENAQPTTSN